MYKYTDLLFFILGKVWLAKHLYTLEAADIKLHQLSSCQQKEKFINSLSRLGGLWVYIFLFKITGTVYSVFVPFPFLILNCVLTLIPHLLPVCLLSHNSCYIILVANNSYDEVLTEKKVTFLREKYVILFKTIYKFCGIRHIYIYI